jgi:hypothetical protein
MDAGSFAQSNDAARELYNLHARFGLQVALHLCHPSFASEDDFMVGAAKKSISDQVLVPLSDIGWDVQHVFRALWAGNRDVIMSNSARMLMSICLSEYSFKDIVSLPLAFPVAYAETVAVYLSCKQNESSSHDSHGTIDSIYDRILSHQSTDATFKRLMFLVDAHESAGAADCLFAQQCTHTIALADRLALLPAYAPSLKNFSDAQIRRQNRCLCLCSAHLAIQSRIMYHAHKLTDKEPNPLQSEIDKLVCLAVYFQPRIGNFLSKLFEKAPYQVPSPSSQPIEAQAFVMDFLALLQADERVNCLLPECPERAHVVNHPQVHALLAKYFEKHLRWLLNAASGAVALTQSMLLDASSPDVFARALIDRAACLKFPFLAAAEASNTIGLVSLHQEKEDIKNHLSDFRGLGDALDQLYVHPLLICMLNE